MASLVLLGNSEQNSVDRVKRLIDSALRGDAGYQSDLNQ